MSYFCLQYFWMSLIIHLIISTLIQLLKLSQVYIFNNDSFTYYMPLYLLQKVMQIEQNERKKQIKSIKQISDQIKNAKKEFDLVINCLSIPNLTMEEDLQKQTPTIDTVLKDLPSQQRLKEMLEHPFADNTERRQRMLANYKGKYELIRKASENIKNLKYQTEKLYYLAAELNLYKIKNEFEDEKKQGITLKSFEVSKNQNFRLPRYERNMISPSYLKQLKFQQQRTTINTNTADYLNIGESLIHINLYDSINGQKVFEYVCYGEQTLLDLVIKFYCLIAKLQEKDEVHHINSFFLIEQNFYFNGSIAKKKIAQLIAFSTHSNEDQYHHQKQRTNLVFEMSKTKLKNLRVVFGRPYLYRHLDGCDHFIIFKDLRILTQNQLTDPIKKDKYPLVVFEGRMRRRKCQGCRTKFATLVSLNDPLKVGKHLYICESCHQNLHSQASNETHTFIEYLHD